MQQYAMSENRFTRQVAKNQGIKEADFEKFALKNEF